MAAIQVEIEKGLARHLKAGHPWVFTRGLAERPKGLEAGAIVDLVENGHFVARGYYDPHSPIVVRVLTRKKDEGVDAGFWGRRVAGALEIRRSFLDLSGTDCFRMVHGESDFLPGVVVDVYAGWAIVKLYSAGLRTFREDLVAAIRRALGDALLGIFGRQGASEDADESDAGGAALWGPEPPDPVAVVENGVRFLVNVKKGQKTGFFLDQRENRLAIRRYARVERAVNCFSFSGGFSVHAALAGAKRVVSVDTDPWALELARENFRVNDLDPGAHEFVEMPVAEFLAAERVARRASGLVILDPPAFAKSAKTVEPALAGYASLNRSGAQVVLPGGILATCSCSARISLEQFFQAVKEGAYKARVDLALLESRGQPPDHPVLLQFPEGRYLKFLVLQRHA
ncbi:MAG: class I SAM-dependent rRNA methyltransferase [Planctomycetes bacterium]|nr:class I SAM-dependent rRNA methyltransferase [Planctomycetota bacterium]